ncbi:hypothetical protein [uncultured Tessaracoccus sp.]|uniref:hypothetical protein n=1 Tax=uncultured Tessaracoccus sp. TaxID=905023 RepID=UPI0025F6C33E|nr:hypothetical protein [uncultured Tessaracoccus sp.]
MTRALGVALALVWAAVAALDLGTTPVWLQSFAQSTEAVVSCIILVWPVATGAGVASAVHRRRTGVDDRLASWPGNARFVLAVRDLGRLLLGATVGALATFVTVGVIATWSGSVPTLATARGLVVALLGVASLLGWGAVLGTVLPSYVVAALAPIVVYLVLWLLPASTPWDPTVFTGTTALAGQALQLDGGALAVLVLWQGATLAAALVVLRLLLSGAETARATTMRRLAGAVTAIGVALGAFLLGPTGSMADPWALRGMDAWDCASVDDDATACLPKDLRPLRDDHLRGMAVVARGLRPLLDDGQALVIASAELPSTPDDARTVIVETSLVDAREQWAGSVTAAVATWEGEGDEPTAECMKNAEAVQDAWLRAFRGAAPPTPAALRALIGACRP